MCAVHGFASHLAVNLIAHRLIYNGGRSYVHGKDQKLRVCQCTRLHGRASALPMYLVSTVVPVIVVPVSMVVPVIVVLVSTVPLCLACLLCCAWYASSDLLKTLKKHWLNDDF